MEEFFGEEDQGGRKGCWMIKNLDHNLDYTVGYCRYIDPSRFDERGYGGLMNRTDGSVDDSYPRIAHSVVVVDKLLHVVNNGALTVSDHNNSLDLLDTFAVFANYRIVHLDRCWSLQIAGNQNKFQNCKKIS